MTPEVFNRSVHSKQVDPAIFNQRADAGLFWDDAFNRINFGFEKAYLFPLWLGIQLFWHFHEVTNAVRRTAWSSILIVVAVTFGLTIAEDRIMERLGFPDSYNALQISNQFYACAFLILLIKLPVRLVPAFIDVRKDSYGIYLAHLVIVSIGLGVMHLFTGTTGLAKFGFGPLTRIALWFLWSAIIYFASLLVDEAAPKNLPGLGGRRQVPQRAGFRPARLPADNP